MDIYDVIIIGAGPAGLTAAIYTSRAKLSTLVLEKMVVGGQATTTFEIENYPGFVDPINGFLLMNNFENQAKKFGAEIKIATEITKLDKNNEIFEIEANNGDVFKARTIIIATGAKFRKLGLPSEEKFIGKGISFCATCDGAFFKEKEVAVIGGGNSALEEALFLTKFVKKVYLVHRRKEFRADKVIQERVLENPKIEPVLNYIPKEIIGEEEISGLIIQEKDTKEEKILKVDGIFVFIGLEPNTGFLNNFVKMDDNGYIITDEECKTNINGCFAAGDVRKKTLRQVATAVGDGAIAANSVKEFLN